MKITINLPLEIEANIKTQASENGVKVEDYLVMLIEEEIKRREKLEKNSEKSFREILAPIHKEFEESGITEEELLEMLEQAREEVWQGNAKADL